MNSQLAPQELLSNGKAQLTTLQIRRAAYDKLIASLAVPQYTSIAGQSIVKAKAATGVMGTV